MKTEKSFKVYVAICERNHKKYVGITTQSLAKRIAQHKSHTSKMDTKLGRAIRKYGFDSFSFLVVAEAFNREDLYALEKQIIEQYGSQKTGYNSTSGGDGIVNFEYTPEIRHRLSLASRKRWESLRDKYIESAKLGWLNKTEEERNKHKERARRTRVKTLKSRPNTIKIKPVSWKGKGWNMKIKTQCPQGHEYNEQNTRYNISGSRVCIICKRVSRNKARDRKRHEGGKKY